MVRISSNEVHGHRAAVRNRAQRGPGMGHVKFEPIAAALREIACNSSITVEAFAYSPGPDTIDRDRREYLRRVFRE